jgi:glycosyltransferase involved in cell wall biosynthesis
MINVKNPTIFIQIASYRDPQLLPTLEDLLMNAKNPERLVFSIAWQHDKEDLWDNLDRYKDDPRFKIIDIDYKDSNGACWARNLIQQQYDGETYTLQIDSHHRFTKNWDYELIRELKKLQKKGHKKPMLTGYIPSFEPDNDPAMRLKEPWKMNFDRFAPDGNVHFLPATIDDFKTRKEPLPARFYSAHFCFTLGQFVKEVPHDPEYYFHGEEISISVRSFTWGYDLFHLHRVLIWHYYTRKGLKKHWDDDSKWYEKNDYSHLKNRKLFGMDGEVYDLKEFGIYGFGSHRTLEDYEKYAGISFSKRAVQQYTLDFKSPPNPTITDPEEYDKSFSNYFKHCIDIGFDQVPHDDYDVWAVAFEDEDGVELVRLDANENEIKSMKNDPDGYCKVWRSFNTVKRPHKWIVWPHSKEHGWINRMEGILYEKK